jgi:ParB/RepB/Spo0J family partition protein
MPQRSQTRKHEADSAADASVACAFFVFVLCFMQSDEPHSGRPMWSAAVRRKVPNHGRSVMKSGLVQLSVPLSRLIPSRRNPRKVKPSREAHQRLVALIRSQGLLQPLVVRSVDGKSKRFEVVAGDRRLRALRKIHRSDGDPKIPCVLRDVDTATADAMSLGENFGREAMHPLDEAEAFAKLATSDGKDAEAIAAEFGVPEHYVRQRMKLATLAEPVKAAHREGSIDTGTAEAFAAVPQDRQIEVWKELNGNPRHAEHVRNIIANAWIDAKHAMFDLSTLAESAMSRDLFGDRVLIERQAFMEAQAKALDGQRQMLTEEGWSEIVIGRREDVQDRLYAMDTPEREFDEPTSRKLAKIETRREKLEAMAKKIGDDDANEAKLRRLQQRYETLEAEEQEIVEQAPEHFSEETKAVATSFLILDPDGRVHREYRLPRRKHQQPANGNGDAARGGAAEKPKAPTSDELSDKQLAATFTHQALAVREALFKNAGARKRVLALILHEKVRSESLAVRHEPNGITLHASSEGFSSPAFDRLGEKRVKLDPFLKDHFVEDWQGYEQVGKLSASKIDALIDLLIVDCITAHMQRRTELVHRLATELKVNIRDYWRPDAAWLSGFQKIQLAHLVVEIKGAVHAPAPERKKSELVEVLAKLFTDAAEGKLDDKQLAERANRWLPLNLREVKEEATEEQEPVESKRC